MSENGEGPNIFGPDAFNNKKKKGLPELAADRIGLKKPGDHVTRIEESEDKDGKKVINTAVAGISKPDRLLDDVKDAWNQAQEEKEKYEGE